MGIVRRESGLLVFSPKFKPVERIVVINGRRCRVWVDDSKTVKQVEENDRLHAVASPKAIRVQTVMKKG